jgi:hypothetical protein
MKKMTILYITISLIVFLLVASQLYAVNETNKIEMYSYTVVKNYGASKNKVPEFIPVRIKSKIKGCIKEYLNDN